VLRWENAPEAEELKFDPFWSDSPTTTTESPSKEVLDLLLHNTRSGKISRLVEAADRIQSDSPHLALFCERLRALSEGFRIRELREWLGELRREEDAP